MKYFPYNRRTAALLLRTQGESDGRSSGPPGAANQQPAQDAKGRAFDRVKTQAETKAKAGDFDGALLILDGSAQSLQGYAPYHVLVGTYSLRYASQALANGGQASQIDGLYADAVRQLQMGVELNGKPVEPRLELAQAFLDSGDIAAASFEAEKLLSHIRSSGGTRPEWLLATHRVRADACTRVYIQGAQAGNKQEAELQKARASFRRIEESGALDDKQVRVWASLEQWAGDLDAALAVYGRALARQPTSQEWLQQLVEVGCQNGRSQKAVEALSEREDATGSWYLGKARFCQAQEMWAGGESRKAISELARAIDAFEASKRTNPEFATSADQWIAFCLGSEGVIRTGEGQTGKAARALIKAAATSPSQVTADLGGGNTIKRAILVLGGQFFEKGDARRAELMFRRAAAAVPQDIDFANNHGLMARDFGVTLEDEGKTEEAKAMFEASYAAYTRAAELDPESIRLVNDRALLLIYHLNRDLDMARDLLLQTIARGEDRLANTPPSDPAALRDLQEAVGDCYQNLGVYQHKHLEDAKTARASWKKSLTFYPFEERSSAEHLRSLDEAEEKVGRQK